LEAILDLGEAFIDLEQEDSTGDCPLIHYARNWGSGYKPEIFELLLDRGANVNARNSEGSTCLQVCLMSANNFRSQAQDSLILLIRNGASVYNVDIFDHSMTGLANGDTAGMEVYEYGENFIAKRTRLGSYHGDLWDAVLAQCGYSISELREDYPRSPRYTEEYTRQHFEKLWEGKEELCPYFNDPPIWYPHGTKSIIEEDDEELDEKVSETQEISGSEDEFL
jgi:hypothetical protein